LKTQTTDQDVVRVAIILASDDKGAERVFGIPAVRRLALLLIRFGYDTIHVVGQVRSLFPLLSDIIPQRSFHAVEKDESPAQIVERLILPTQERMLVLKANLVIDPGTLSQFLASCETKTCRMTAAKMKGPSDGLYLVGRYHLAPILEAVFSPEGNDVAVLDEIDTVPSSNGLPHLLDRAGADARLSEEKLVQVLGGETVADDGLIARHFDRRISRFISKRVAHTGITPNQITLAGMTIGLIGALLMAQAGYWLKLIGSLLFVFCVVVDGVDGEVARLKLKESRFGHYLDIVTDNIVHVAVFIGIAFGLYHDTGNTAYLKVLLLMMGGLGLCIVAVYQCILRLDEDALKASPTAIRLMALVTNRDFAYLVLLLATLGRLNWFLVGAAVGSYLFAIALWVLSSHEKQSRSKITGHETG
jgi:phosphatidylglycerophosphate synthase